MKKSSEKFSMQNEVNQRKVDIEYYQNIDEYWDKSIGSNLDKLRSFTKYVPFGEFPKFIAKYEIFKKIIDVHGSIVECGVHQGSGLMTWGILSSIFEPINHVRKIIGFDTFEGFTEMSEKDIVSNEHSKKGGLAVNSYLDLQNAIKNYDLFRPLGHINKIELVKGDANTTIPKYVEDNPQLVISLLYLDFDIYKPTKTAINSFIRLMPKGSIIVFDELNNEFWPGETIAVQESIGIGKLNLKRFHFHPQISYAVIE